MPVKTKSKRGFGKFISCSKHFGPIRKKCTPYLKNRKYFKQMIQNMEPPLHLIVPESMRIKSHFSPKCLLGGSRSLNENEHHLIKSFMESLLNSPAKSKIKRLLEGKVMTKLEHKDVAKALLKGLPDHANDSDELEDKRKEMKSAAQAIIRYCRKMNGDKEEEDTDTEYDVMSVNDAEDDDDDDDDDEDDDNDASDSDRQVSPTKSMKIKSSDEEESDQDEEDGSVKEVIVDKKRKKNKDADFDEMVDLELELDTAFIPLCKKPQTDVTGAITNKQTLITGCYRPKYEGPSYQPVTVTGVGPGTLKIETELNEDGSPKKRGAKGYFPPNESSWYFYKGGLSELGKQNVPLKSGVRITDQQQYENLCADICVRAFSQNIFQIRDIWKEDDRKQVQKKILKWLIPEIKSGVIGSMEQIIAEFKQKTAVKKAEDFETKRKAAASFDELKKKMKKN